jgi:GMP synthase-like glutamine amidotransferase
VFDLGDIDVLFGLNWFRATGAGLYHAQQLLKFGDTSIQLNRYNIQNDMDDDIAEVHMVHADDADLLPINFVIFSNSLTA